MTNVDITQAASSKEHAAVIYERLGEGLRDVRIRELVDDDYADLEAHVARLLACVPMAPDPGLVLALVEGRLLRWLATPTLRRPDSPRVPAAPALVTLGEMRQVNGRPRLLPRAW